MEKEVIPEFEIKDIIQYLGYFGLLVFTLMYMPYTAIAQMSYADFLGSAGTWIFYLSMLFFVLMPVFYTIKAKKLANGSFGISMILVAISMFITDTGNWADTASTNWYVTSALTIIVGILFLALSWLKGKEKYEEMAYLSILWLIVGILVGITAVYSGIFAGEFHGLNYTIGLTITYADLYPQMIYFGGKLAVLWAGGIIVTSIIGLIKKFGFEHEVLGKLKYVISSLTQVAFLLGVLYAGMGIGWPTWGTWNLSGSVFTFFGNFAMSFGYMFLWAILGIFLILTILFKIISKGKAVTE